MTRATTSAKASVVIWLLSALAASTAFADETIERIKPSAGQLEWNARSVKASEEGDYEKAIGFLEASLDIGELNVTYLNLGRTYQKAKRCFEAERAYLSALEAPQADVQYPSPEDVRQLVEKFRAELRETCPGKLEITCKHGEMTFSVDEDIVRECGAGPFVLGVGTHTVLGRLFDWEVRRDVQIKALETTALTLEVDASPDMFQARELLARGDAHLIRKETDHAIHAFTEAAEYDPSWALPRKRLAELMMKRGDLPDALEAHKNWLSVAANTDKAAIEATINDIKARIQSQKEAELRALADKEAAEEARIRRKRLTGIGWLIGGAAALGGAVALDTLPDSASNFEHDAMDFVPWPIYIAGTSAIIYGIFSLTEDDEPQNN